jgi:hypothetical protein
MILSFSFFRVRNAEVLLLEPMAVKSAAFFNW